VRAIAALMFGIMVIALALRFSIEYRGSRDRGRFVASMVREQIGMIRQLPDPVHILHREANWPDDFLALQGWLVVKLARGHEPDQVRRELAAMASRHAFSPALATSLNRWQETLARWSRTSGSDRLRVLSPAEAMAEGRRYFYEASGYRKIGRSYDASALYLWSASLLVNFIDRAPLDRDVPEALYLLGDICLRFRHALPPTLRPDRMLNLCSELYPDSVWGNRARALWMEDLGHAT
jgi:hypothetical protein